MTGQVYTSDNNNDAVKKSADAIAAYFDARVRLLEEAIVSYVEANPGCDAMQAYQEMPKLFTEFQPEEFGTLAEFIDLTDRLLLRGKLDFS